MALESRRGPGIDLRALEKILESLQHNGGSRYSPNSARSSRAASTIACSLPIGDVARQVLHAAVGRDDDVLLGRHVGERAADARRHGLGRLDRHVGQVEAADHDRLARQLLQHRAVEARLRGLDRDLAAASSPRAPAGTSSPTGARG